MNYLRFSATGTELGQRYRFITATHPCYDVALVSLTKLTANYRPAALIAASEARRCDAVCSYTCD